MKQQLLSALMFSTLVGAAAAEAPGWFVEVPATAALNNDNMSLLKQSEASPSAGKDLFNLRAGFHFSPAFSLVAGLDEYLLDTAGNRACASTDFVCLSGRDRDIELGTAYSFSLAPAIQLDDDLSIYGHLGVQEWRVRQGGDGGENLREVLFGVGVGYDISNPFRLHLEYRSMDLDIKLTSIGFTWRF